MTITRRLLTGLLTTCAVVWPATAAPVTLTSLLTEMTDRDAMARYPDPAYLCRQFSSYDRASKDPQHDWFANGDVDQFLREETNGGRKEWVLMDADGPGAVVRFWSANPPAGCNVRFYLDGAAEAAWTVDFQKLTNGSGVVGQPLSQVVSSGWNSYLPVPYAGHCKITTDKRGFYYQVNYRTYTAGTAVESFTPALLDAAKPEIDRVQHDLLAVPMPVLANELNGTLTIEPRDQATLPLPDGPGVVRQVSVKVMADKLPEALRALVVEVECDGEPCIWAPLSDFFGSGVGVNAYQDWYRTVAKDGTLTARFVMPYEKNATLSVKNLGDAPVTIEGSIGLGPWKWDARSMHFHANWHWQYPLDTKEKQDWNYVQTTGKGVYLGDSLAVFNPVGDWWGEGDEKIYVDGETFPSHFGTGTEDYYGYAWCDPHVFTHPFHAQPRCDGPRNKGNTTVTRTRCLDAIPFTTGLKFDMEAWHWAATQVSYACTTYWYGTPGAKSNRVPQPEGALAALPQPPPVFKLAGALEAEELKPSAATPGLAMGPQETGGYGETWSGASHLWVQGKQVGDFVEFKLPADGTDPRKVTFYGTKSWDYGVLKITVNGKVAVEQLDCWAEQVTPTGAVDLGTLAPQDGGFTVRVEVVGKNEKSRGTGSFFGIDAFTVTKP